jgi:hypothetical protein
MVAIRGMSPNECHRLSPVAKVAWPFGPDEIDYAHEHAHD